MVFVCLLCVMVMLVTEVPAISEGSSDASFSGIRNILLIVSLDKTLPKTGKT